MFEKFEFTRSQIDKFFAAAERDLGIAGKNDTPEVKFRFSYDALLKLAIAVCATGNLRVKARAGHHVDLIKKLAQYLGDKEIEVLADDMRAKRNWDLYGGGIMISAKDAESYYGWTKKVFKKGDSYLKEKLGKLI